MTKREVDREFQDLAIKINAAIIENDGLIGDQKEQVDLVFSLERKFQFYANKYQKTSEIYKKFIDLIVNEKGNILSAGTYFRESKTTFNNKIASCIKNNNIEELMKFNINYQFIDFIINNWEGNIPDRVNKYYQEFLKARNVLIENNLPLAINRAKLFYRKTPKSHLTLLDLIDICTYGLISGVDKYVGEYTKVWRSVCIGRMVGFMIEEYSKTFIRMYPIDKKILYRANSLKYRLGIENIGELVIAVNESFEKDKEEGKGVPKLPITEVHIRTLMNGSGYVSADSPSEEEHGNSGSRPTYSVYEKTQDSSKNTEEEVEKKDLMVKIHQISSNLKTIERKVIKLKGVNL